MWCCKTNLCIKTSVVLVFLSTRTCTVQSRGFMVAWRRAGWWPSDWSMITVQRPGEEMARSWSERAIPMSQTSPSPSGTTSKFLISWPAQPKTWGCFLCDPLSHYMGRSFPIMWPMKVWLNMCLFFKWDDPSRIHHSVTEYRFIVFSPKLGKWLLLSAIFGSALEWDSHINLA